MKLPKTRFLLAMTLGLAATASYSPTVKADAINYSTVGSVDTPAGGIANMVYFNGLNNGTLNPVNGIEIGQFQVSSLSATTSQTYSSTPFHIQVYSGGNQGDQINGVLNGSVGPHATGPLTATITSISQYLSSPLPFTINIPLNTPMTLNTTLPGGQAPASTDVIGPVTMVPEPASVVVFAVAIGGLGVYARRRHIR
jgi:hypothetical protein